MNKLFLLDAYAIIYRSYYAFINNPRINSKGLNTSAMFGFINTLEEVLKKEKPTHIAVVFDPKGGTFRHKFYPEYKAQREATPEDIKLSIPIIKNIISAYNIPIIEVENYEADDVIGTLAKKAEKEGFTVYMLTPDKDYAQLVSENIFMFRPKHTGGYETMGVEAVKAKYEIENVLQVIDFLGLMGDSSDNVPGCPGVGEKTAIKLLKQFGSIDNMLESTNQLKGALKKKVEENREVIKISKYLVTIVTDVPVEFDEERLKLEPIDQQKLQEIFEELEFKTLLKRVLNIEQPTVATTKASTPSLFDFETTETETESEETAAPIILLPTNSIQNTQHTYHLVDSAESINALVQNLMAQSSVCFDTETTGVDTFNSEIVGVSFCWEKGVAYYVPLSEKRAECQERLDKFAPFFANEEIEKVGQNMKFDILMLSQYGIEVKGKMFDTMIAHYLIQPELRHGMDYLAEIYLQYTTIKYEDMIGKKPKSQQNIRAVDIETLKEYAAEDADITYQLRQPLSRELAENGLEDLFYNMEMPLMQVLCTIERNGVRIDSEALRESSEILTGQLLELEKEIHKLAGAEFNVSSPMQVGEILFERLRLNDKAKKTKSGQYSTSEDILQKLKAKHPIVDKILQYRGLKKLLSTYIDALPLMVNRKTGLIHTSYNQTVAATGRLSSTNPNLQNIPIRNEQGREIRKVFVPEANSTFLSVDYSQIELRIMAHISGDKNMIEAFNSGLDIHSATAAKIYGIDVEEVTSDMRRKAKTANFGIIYGISVFGLSDRLSIPRAEAKELIEGYFATYPEIKNYMDRAIEQAKKDGFVATIYGRKRYLTDINSKNAIVRGYAERNAINAPIQGSAADIIKLAMINIQNRLSAQYPEAKMSMQVHDELNFSVPNEQIESVKELVKKEMENVIHLSVPLIAECGVGNNWLEAH